MAWCPGGPLINAKNASEGKTILEKFKDCVLSEGIINLRCKSYSKIDDLNTSLFSLFPKSSNNITSSKSIIHKITNVDEFLKMSENIGILSNNQRKIILHGRH